MSTVAHECSLHGCYIHFTQLHVLITLHSCKALALKYKHITLFLFSENCWQWALKLLSWWCNLSRKVNCCSASKKKFLPLCGTQKFT